MKAHVVVDAPAGIDNLRMIAQAFGFMGEVVRIHSDAMTSHQTWFKVQEVPLGAGSLQHFVCVNAHAREDERQLIDKSDVDIALCVFNDLGSFGYLDGRSLVRAGFDDTPVEGIHPVGNFGRTAAGNFLDVYQPVLLVSGIDAFGRIATKKSRLNFNPLACSSTGTQSSSVQPG